MSEKPPLSMTLPSRFDQAFPKLTPAQIARMLPHGRVRPVQEGEVLVDEGHFDVPFFVITSGQIEIMRPSGSGETIVALHEAGEFTGEIQMLTGRRSLVRAVVTAAGEVIEFERSKIQSLVQTDSELSEILMRAFILRRVELIARGIGDVVVVGSSHCRGTLRIRDFLSRNGHPYSYIDLEREAEVQELLDRFQVALEDIPVVICRGETVLRNPTIQELVECLGYNVAIDETQPRDLVIVGAGPAGLAAAVYGASEGLNVLVLESNAPGGQAGSSSRIENYLGFPTGISGQELASRAYTQAQKFGTQVMIAKNARRLACERGSYAVETDDGMRIPARAVVLASGAQYRRLPLDNLSQFEGAGVYYAASYNEEQLCQGEEVIVVGGGNSAGQAAVFLAQSAKRVHMLIRAGSLSESMSRYLIRRIEESSAITLRTRTEIAALEGNTHLERVQWKNNLSGAVETREIRHVFLMMGAIPSTSWLEGCLALDSKGFIKTGPELSAEDLAAANWPLTRAPYLLEASVPGIFAVGDVRGGSIKRVASAVGEGSIAISFVHQFLKD